MSGRNYTESAEEAGIKATHLKWLRGLCQDKLSIPAGIGGEYLGCGQMHGLFADAASELGETDELEGDESDIIYDLKQQLRSEIVRKYHITASFIEKIKDLNKELGDVERMLKLRSTEACYVPKKFLKLYFNRSNDKTCGVCLDDQTDFDETVFFPCGHYYHFSCIQRSDNKSCGVCNIKTMVKVVN